MKFVLLCFFTLVLEQPSSSPETNSAAPSIRIVTGGYEAQAAIKNNKAITGPKTNMIRSFMEATGLPYSIEVMPWGRAYALNRKDDTSLIYPLTRTKSRDADYTWLLELERRDYHLLGHRSLQELDLPRDEIISGKYFAVCEATASSCELLQEFGFSEQSIIRVRGKSVVGIIPIIASGRASFMLEDSALLNDPTFAENYSDVVRVGDYTLVMREYLAAHRMRGPLLTKLQQTLMGWP